MKCKCKRLQIRLLIPLLCWLLLSGCSSSGETNPSPQNGADSVQTGNDRDSAQTNGTKGTTDADGTEGMRDNAPKVLTPSPDGIEVYSNEEVCIDASNLSEGYVMVKYTGSAEKVRLLLDTPAGDTYNYRIPLDGTYTVIPLSDGSGAYGIGIYENIVEDKYAEIFSQDVQADIADENKTFLYPNQYVNFDASCKAVEKGAELARGASTELDVVTAVYDYVTKNVSYDYDKAETVQSGYLPDVDETLATGKGICFDYAALMATMLRTQGIPTKLEIGYVDSVYHAWVSVYIKDQGWIEDIIYFDGQAWRLMDPTLGSYAKESTIRDHMDKADSYYDMKYKY